MHTPASDYVSTQMSAHGGIPGDPACVGQASAIEAFLADFAAGARRFRSVSQSYLQGSLDLGAITRALSESTADAELLFSEYSPSMSMEQLQRFASLQKAFDIMMEQIFSEEIRRNRQTLAKAIEHGEYFLINVLRRGIESAIYMLHSKDRIKTAQDQALAALEAQHAQVQTMLRVIRALENSSASVVDLAGLEKVETALSLYLRHFAALPRTELLTACDRRLLVVVQQHCQGLLGAATGPITAGHVRRCTGLLGRLPHADALEPLLSDCQRLANGLGSQAPRHSSAA